MSLLSPGQTDSQKQMSTLGQALCALVLTWNVLGEIKFANKSLQVFQSLVTQPK